MIVDRSLATSQGEWAVSFVIAAPDLVQGAAQNLAGIRASLAEAAAMVAAPTTGVVPAAADEVSAAISVLFGNFGQQFQTLSAQAQAFHADFVSLMNAGAAAYLSTEVANAAQAAVNAISGAGSAGAAGATPAAGGLLGGLLGGGSGSGGLVGGLIGGTSGGGGLLGGLAAATTGGGGLLGGLTGGLLGGLTSGLLGGLGLTGPTPLGLLLGGLLGSSGLGLIHTGPFDGFFSPLVRELRALEQAFLNELHSVEQAVVHAIGGGASFAAAAAATPGAGDLLGGLLGGGSGSGGLVGGLIGGTSGGGGLVGGLTGTSGLGLLGAQDVVATAGYHSGALAAAGQLSPRQQALSNQASNLAKILGLSPVTHPVAGDPDFGSQVTSFGPATQTALADPDDNFFDAIIFSSPQFTDTLTSGFEPTLGLGAPGHTINTVQSPILPFLNSSISIPVTDPIAPLFAALLPLGF
jgi:hypothetical protein